jgi:hypothetical protein
MWCYQSVRQAILLPLWEGDQRKGRVDNCNIEANTTLVCVQQNTWQHAESLMKGIHDEKMSKERNEERKKN